MNLQAKMDELQLHSEVSEKRLDVWGICLDPAVILCSQPLLKCCMKTDGVNSQMGIKATTEVQLKYSFHLSAGMPL